MIKTKNIKIVLLALCTIVLFSCGKKNVQVGSKTFDVSKVYNVYIAQSNDKSYYDSMRKGFVKEMIELGYLEDANVTYTYESAKGNKSYAEQIADNFKTKKPDLILSIGDITTVACVNKISNVPIVFLGVANAERLGLCDSNGIPKKNATGVMDSHLFQEKFNFISKHNPNVKKIGIIYTTDNTMAQYEIDYSKFYAQSYNIDVYTVSIKKAEDINKALDNILPKVDAISLVQDDMVDSVLTTIVNRAKKDLKEVYGDTDEHEKAGCVVATHRDYELVGKKGASLAKSILSGEKAAKDLVVLSEDYKIN